MFGAVANLIPDDIEDLSEEMPDVSLQRVKGSALAKVIEFCKHYLQEPLAEIEKPLRSNDMAEVVPAWYANFVNVEQKVLYQLIKAADYLHIDPLLDLTCATLATKVTAKPPEELRKEFHISHDFTTDEEEQLKKETKWCRNP